MLAGTKGSNTIKFLLKMLPSIADRQRLRKNRMNPASLLRAEPCSLSLNVYRCCNRNETINAAMKPKEFDAHPAVFSMLSADSVRACVAVARIPTLVKETILAVAFMLGPLRDL